MQRRKFLKTGAIAGTALSMPFPVNSMGRAGRVRIGLIGLGLRGRNHLNNLLNRDDLDIPALCDIDEQALDLSESMIRKAGKPAPERYTGNEFAYRDMLERSDIDGVIISTPWKWHTRMAVDAMEAGKYSGIEVSAAQTLEECWELVDTHEKTGVPVMILENVCYRRDVMAVLNMVRENLFGELLHARCGYQHDLRRVKFNDGKQPYGNGVEFGEKAFSEASWRTEYSLKRNADLYPTHGVGPIATMFNINRGNRFVTINSMATKALGLKRYIINHPMGGPDHPNARLDWKLGDVITSTISTANGESVIVTHDCNSPRPYSLGFRVQGTNGLTEFDYHTRRIYIENQDRPDDWDDMDSYLRKFDHPLWRKYGKFAEGSGHGGMDFFVDRAFVEIVKRRLDAPLDAYDAAAWSAITPLSEKSIENNGATQYFPDYTKGRWMSRNPNFAWGDDY